MRCARTLGSWLIAMWLVACRADSGPPAGSLAASPEAPAAVASGQLGPDAGAERLMAEVETVLRQTTRLVRFEIVTRRATSQVGVGYPAREETELWGLIDGSTPQLRQLFVFCEPRRMRGTGLLIDDRAGGDEVDSMWFHMKTFDHFKEIPRESLKLVVAGTCLTYEQARGFLSLDKYRFAWRPAAAAAEPTSETRSVVGWPRGPELAADLGFAWIEAEVDPRRKVLLAATWYQASGTPSKRYRVEEVERFEQLYTARRAVFEDLENEVTSELRQTLWPARPGIPASLYDRAVSDQPLLARARGVMSDLGVAEAVKLTRCGETRETVEVSDGG